MTGWFWHVKLQVFQRVNTMFLWKAKFLLTFAKSKASPNYLNSEIDREAALEIAKQQIEDHHRFLLQQDVDKIVEIKTEVTSKANGLFACAHLVHKIRIQRQSIPVDN